MRFLKDGRQVIAIFTCRGFEIERPEHQGVCLWKPSNFGNAAKDYIAICEMTNQLGKEE